MIINRTTWWVFFQNSLASSKKQGVSGKSLDPGSSLATQKIEKNARSKQMIRDALMDNDFLKNLSPGQVRICGLGCVNRARARVQVTQPSPCIFLHICNA